MRAWLLPATLALAVTAAVLVGCGGPDHGRAPGDAGHTAPLPTATGGAASPGSAPASPAAAPVTSPAGGWRPALGTGWQWQLSGKLDLSVPAPVYDVDGFDTSAATVATLHSQGRRAICYLDMGAWEPYRPDAGRFPASVLGKPLDGWPDERWLDVRRLDVLGPILSARLDMCRQKGFDGVELDDVEGYANDTGLGLTAADQLAFNHWLLGAVRARGMAAGLKNDLAQVGQLVGDADFAVNEQCFQYDECDRLLPFTRAGKAVLQVEYDLSTSKFCAKARADHFSSMRKHLELDAWRQTC